MMLTDYRRLTVTDVDEPTIASDEVLVRVRACGICGSDVHGYDGSSGRRIPPLIMGHEAAGVVERVGGEVADLKPGDRVTFDSTVYCGACRFCQRGEVNLCDNRRVLGVSCGEYRRHGAFAEFVAVPRRICYRLPDELGFEQAAMIEAVAVAVHAVDRVSVGRGDTTVVVGAGMIGLLIVQALKLAGCGRVIAVDVEDRKLELAATLGADDGLNAKQVDAAKRVVEMTDGVGADAALEAVGATEPIRTAIHSLRKGGSAVLVGNLSPKVELPLQAVVTRQLTLYGSCSSSGEYPRCIEAMARGAIRVDPLISAAAPLSEGPAWFERLYNHEPGLMKVILKP